MAGSVQEAFELLEGAPSWKGAGIEGCRRLKAKASLRDIPVIMVTARSNAEDLQLAFNAGAMDYITKPPTRSNCWHACDRRWN